MVRSSGAIEFGRRARLPARSTEKHRPSRHRARCRRAAAPSRHDRGGNLQLAPSREKTKPACVSDNRAHVPPNLSVLKSGTPRQAGTLWAANKAMLAGRPARDAAPEAELLDEPSFGLAPLIVRDLFKILGRHHREDIGTILV